MAKKTNVPEIRFAGFTDPWEQRKLSELTTMHARIGWQNLRTSEFFDSGNYYLITGTDFENGYVNLSTCHYVNKDRYDQDPNIQIDNGSILITKDGTLGKVALVQGLDKPATLNAGVFNVVIRNEEIVDNGYLYQYLKAPFLLNYVAQTATGGTIKHLNQNILVDFPVSMPSKGEQELIGDAFLRLDNLITLHQRKYDKLCAVKKSMLDKIFPKPGEVEPEIRFAGFTDPWEQRKLSELTTMHARIGWQNLRTSEFFDSGNYYLITGTDFENGYVNLSTCHYVNKDRYDQDPNIQIDNGSILITKDGTLGKVALVQGLDKPATLNAGVFNVVIRNEEIVDNGYLYQYLKAPFLLNYVAQTATGGTIKHLNQNILVDFPVSMPSKGEQELIGDAFLRLDNLITLHQRELNLLKNTKKSLLDKMFV